jgi:hypothetical protein
MMRRPATRRKVSPFERLSRSIVISRSTELARTSCTIISTPGGPPKFSARSLQAQRIQRQPSRSDTSLHSKTTPYISWADLTSKLYRERISKRFFLMWQMAARVTPNSRASAACFSPFSIRLMILRRSVSRR